MKRKVWEIGQFSKDIEKARKISDKEYEKRLKKRGRNISLYKIDSVDKLVKVFARAMAYHPDVRITPKNVKELVSRLDARNLIAPEVVREFDKLKPTDIQRIISNLSR
jgi:hypothetical protein